MNYRVRKVISSKIRRALRWEFWPMWFFYIPLAFYIVCKTIRYRGLVFLSVNPGLPMSGFIGERKAQTLLQLKETKELARFCFIDASLSEKKRVSMAKVFISDNDLSYPVVFKPDLGQRGLGVMIVDNELALLQCIQKMNESMILQEYISGEEYGVFYYRFPGAEKGHILSITDKQFPEIVGDGITTLEQFILENKRTHYMAEFLLELHSHQLDKVLDKGEAFQVVQIGSHCRGAIFKEGGHYMSESLRQVIDDVSQSIDGFYFGRYDIRVPPSGDFRQGKELKVIEVNGVTSESTNIYDPSYSVLKAYLILFKQWGLAFEIGKKNIQNGHKRVTLYEFFRYVSDYLRS